MKPTAEIRPAAAGDEEDVYRLLTEFVVSYRPRREAFDRSFPELAASPTAQLLVADLSGQIIGYALALRVPTLYANGILWQLQELMVDARYRSQGVGRRLLEAVTHRARAEGAVEVVLCSSRAGAYYERLGFTEAARYYKYKLTNDPAPASQPGKENCL